MVRRVDQFAVHFDVIDVDVRLRTEFGDDITVDADMPLNDQFLGLAAAGDAGVGDDLLQTFEGHSVFSSSTAGSAAAAAAGFSLAAAMAFDSS